MTSRPPRTAVIINRVLAASLVGTALWHWRLFGMLFSTIPWSILGIVLILLVVLLIASAVGLARMSLRGYYFAYVLVPFATMFHSLPLVPVITSVLPTLWLRIASVFLLNSAFLVAVVISHRSLRRGAHSAVHEG